jgi:hypothetical protein
MQAGPADLDRVRQADAVPAHAGLAHEDRGGAPCHGNRRQSPFWRTARYVKRTARPHKSAIYSRFTVGVLGSAQPPRAGPDRRRPASSP